MICVLPILFSGFCLATYSGTLIPTPDWATIPYLDLNLGTIGALLYASLYVLLEPVAGTALALVCLASTAFTNFLRVQNPDSTLQTALAVHIVCWVAQFIGHGLFEGRAPALLDNLIQAIFLAPIFVWLELLFKLGYRRELQGRVQKAVEVKVAKFNEAPKNGKAE
jgi:uncharacterized membrane protein YGL010W